MGSEQGVTLLYDEIDTVFGPKARDNEEIRGLLNAGHHKGAVAGRCVVRGKAIETEEIPAYAAVAMAGLGWLPDTIKTRSVIIKMRRRHDGERVEQYRRRLHAAGGFQVRDAVATWASAATVEWPDLPPSIQDRDADIWESLIAIADAVGGPWPEKSRKAALALVSDSKDDDTSPGVRLLADIKTVFEDAAELPTKAILDGLIALPESPWGDVRGKPLDDRRLASRLRAYGIKPKQLRVGTSTPRGYCRADFEEQWRSYLPSLPQKSKTTETSKTTSENTASNGGPVLDVLDVLDLAGKGGGRICDHCHEPGELQQVYCGGDEAWLHRDCQKPWLAAQDDLTIPPYLDRRAAV
jgi:hypothetical protein